jgi:hypothetical protein
MRHIVDLLFFGTDKLLENNDDTFKFQLSCCAFAKTFISMGADALNKTVQEISAKQKKSLTPKGFDVPCIDTDLLKLQSSTLTETSALELVNRCSNVNTVDEERKIFKEIGSKTPIVPSEIGTDPNYKFKYVWFNLIGFVILNTIGLFGVLAAFLNFCKLLTFAYGL